MRSGEKSKAALERAARARARPTAETMLRQCFTSMVRRARPRKKALTGGAHRRSRLAPAPVACPARRLWTAERARRVPERDMERAACTSTCRRFRRGRDERRALVRAPDWARRGAHRVSALHALPLEADVNASFGSPTYFAGDGHAIPRPILTGARRIRPALTALLAARSLVLAHALMADATLRLFI